MAYAPTQPGFGGKGGGTTPLPAPGTQPPAALGGKGGGAAAPNVYDQSAQALTGAYTGTANAMQYAPQQVGAPVADVAQYRPAQTGIAPRVNAQNVTGVGYNPATARSTGYGAAGVNAPGAINADQVAAGQLGQTDLAPYMNPYQSGVIDSTLSQLDRQRQQVQIGNRDAATAAKAFGGDRHGILEAETNRGFADTAANTVAQLNAANFGQAQAAAGQDIQSRMQAALANQGANLQAGSLNAGNQLQAGLANQAALNTSRQFGADAANTAQQFNAQQRNFAGQFGADARNTANLANQSAGLQAGTTNAQNALQSMLANLASRNQANQFNATAANQGSQFNAGTQMQAQLANQAAGLSGNAQSAAAAGQLGNLANLGFGMGNQITQQQMQQGSLQQAMQQQLMDAARGQYGGFTSSPQSGLQSVLAALGGANMGQQTQTTSQQPGLFNYLSLFLGI